MAAWVDVMEPGTESPILPLGRRTVFQALKFIMPMVILAAAALALMHRVNQVNQTMHPIVLTFATAASMGVVSGISTRWALRQRAWLARVVVAIAAVVIGLEILGLLTFGRAGLDMLSGPRTEIDWIGFGQISAGALTALMVLRAWHARASQVSDTIIQGERHLDPLVVPAPEPRISVTPQPRVSHPTRSRLGLRWPVHLRPRLGVPRFPRLTTWPSLTWGRRSQVRMNGDEQHRCPYCLDLIERRDRRGVKICPICHTWHHADCWSLTGMCQIPHHHA